MDEPDLTQCNATGEPLPDEEAAHALALALLRAEHVARRLGRRRAAVILADARDMAWIAVAVPGPTRH